MFRCSINGVERVKRKQLWYVIANQKVVNSDDNHLDVKIPYLYKKDLVVYNLIDKLIV